MSYLVGFTGTREGMTASQQAGVERLLRAVVAKHGRVLMAHGDCIGADAECDAICARLGIHRGIYPANIPGKRAHCETRGALKCADEAPPLARNIEIIIGRKLLIAGPQSDVEMSRSGTWYTVRHARTLYAAKGGHIAIVWPDGRATLDFPVGDRRVLFAT